MRPRLKPDSPLHSYALVSETSSEHLVYPLNYFTTNALGLLAEC